MSKGMRILAEATPKEWDATIYIQASKAFEMTNGELGSLILANMIEKVRTVIYV